MFSGMSKRFQLKQKPSLLKVKKVKMQKRRKLKSQQRNCHAIFLFLKLLGNHACTSSRYPDLVLTWQSDLNTSLVCLRMHLKPDLLTISACVTAKDSCRKTWRLGKITKQSLLTRLKLPVSHLCQNKKSSKRFQQRNSRPRRSSLLSAWTLSAKTVHSPKKRESLLSELSNHSETSGNKMRRITWNSTLRLVSNTWRVTSTTKKTSRHLTPLKWKSKLNRRLLPKTVKSRALKNRDNSCSEKPATQSSKGLSSPLKKQLCTKSRLNVKRCVLLKA